MTTEQNNVIIAVETKGSGVDTEGRKHARCNFLSKTKFVLMYVDFCFILCYYIITKEEIENIENKEQKEQSERRSRKMRKYSKDKTYITEFNNITELVHFIETKEIYSNFKNRLGGASSISGDMKFTETSNFDEAKDLLLHGWEYGTKEIKAKVEAKNIGVSLKQKTVYDVAGYQCSVPRYLQGIPTNMINKKAIPQKNKVITINKMCSYICSVRAETIKAESVKVLQLVNTMEKQGYRVNLNVLYGSEKGNTSIIKVKIKSSAQKLNIKQTAFPLVHPSMLRRIIFAVWERSEECSCNGFEIGYGKPCDESMYKQILNKGEYLIPAVLSEQEIIDIDKYKIN